MNSTLNRTQDLTESCRHLISFFAFGALVLALGSGFIIARSIYLPLQKLKAATAEIGKGNLDTAIEVNSNDEIGRVAVSLKKMTDDLKKITTSIDNLKQEITDRKKAEQALRESETRFRSLYENSVLGLYRTTPEGNIIMANPALVRMLGYDSFEGLSRRNLEEGGYESDYPREKFKKQISILLLIIYALGSLIMCHHYEIFFDKSNLNSLKTFLRDNSERKIFTDHYTIYSVDLIRNYKRNNGTRYCT